MGVEEGIDMKLVVQGDGRQLALGNKAKDGYFFCYDEGRSWY